ncbi:MAG: peptidoglycan-binding protein [Parvibaculaceae bacterium]
MRSGVPWSVKGIEPEAREAAKQAARRAGVTLGAWLNQVIMDGGTDEVGLPDLDGDAPFQSSAHYAAAAPQQNYQPQPQAAPQQAAPQHVEHVAIDMAPVAEAVRDIVNRVEQSERRTQDLARRMEQSVGMLAERLEHSERHSSERQMEDAMPDPRTFDPLERKIAQLAERLEVAERGRSVMGRKGFDDYKAQITTLEKAVNAVVDHLGTAEKRSEESLAEIRMSLNAIASRVDDREEQEAREEAAARARSADETMLMLAQRLEKMEGSVANVGGQAVDAALKAIAEKDDAARHKQTMDNLQHHLTEITHRLERAEKRTDDTLKTFELTVTGIARRLEDLDHNQGNQLAHEVDARLEEMASRLQQSEDISLSAAQTIERAIAGMSDSLNSSDNRARETTDNLNVLLERMTDRLGRIERETKATRSSVTQTMAAGALTAPLGASVAVGGPGFVPGGAAFPGGQAFPIPNFDAPSLGGGYNATNEFRSPDMNEAYRATPEAHIPLVSDDYDDLPPPPPFAPSSSDESRVEPHLGTSHDDEDEVVDLEELSTAHSEGTARAANDFMAAARRAAQAASATGRNGAQPALGPNGYAAQGYGQTSSRYSAADEAQAKKKKIIFGAIAAILTLVIALGAVKMLGSEPQIVTVAPVANTKAASNEGAPADMGASTEVTSVAPVPTTVPAGPSHPNTTSPEATPDSAEAKAPAAASAPTKSATPAPAATPVARPKTSKQTNNVTDGPAITPGPMANAAPTKPVASAPGSAAVPAGERDLRSAAIAGNPAAQYEVGQRYANGENVPQDLAQAAYWYGLASDQGLAIAQYRLAALYEKGRGVTQDNSKARALYEKAANKGNVKAMHNLAVIYADGRGANLDYASAARWFTAAADYDLRDSQYNLAILQERGLGVTQDLTVAYKWFAIAAKDGDKGAAAKRDEVAAKLNGEKLARAKALVAAWQPKRPDPVANGDLSSLGSWAQAAMVDGGDMTASITPAAPDTSPDTTLARNDLGRAQAMLIKLGYQPGSSDGLMGPRTHEAIVNYQRAAGLEQTGNVNPALLKSLEIASR